MASHVSQNHTLRPIHFCISHKAMKPSRLQRTSTRPSRAIAQSSSQHYRTRQHVPRPRNPTAVRRFNLRQIMVPSVAGMQAPIPSRHARHVAGLKAWDTMRVRYGDSGRKPRGRMEVEKLRERRRARAMPVVKIMVKGPEGVAPGDGGENTVKGGEGVEDVPDITHHSNEDEGHDIRHDENELPRLLLPHLTSQATMLSAQPELTAPSRARNPLSDLTISELPVPPSPSSPSTAPAPEEPQPSVSSAAQRNVPPFLDTAAIHDLLNSHRARLLPSQDITTQTRRSQQQFTIHRDSIAQEDGGRASTGAGADEDERNKENIRPEWFEGVTPPGPGVRVGGQLVESENENGAGVEMSRVWMETDGEDAAGAVTGQQAQQQQQQEQQNVAVAHNDAEGGSGEPGQSEGQYQSEDEVAGDREGCPAFERFFGFVFG